MNISPIAEPPPIPLAQLRVLHAEKYYFPKPWRITPALLPYSMIRLITSGTGKFTIDGTEFEVASNDLVAIPAGCMLGGQAADYQFSFISIRFSTSFTINGHDEFIGLLGAPLIIQAVPGDAVAGFVNALEAMWHFDSGQRNYAAVGYLHLILASFIEHAQSGILQKQATNLRTGSQNLLDPRIDLVRKHITTNPSRSLSVRELCKLASMSESTLRRRFKAQIGKTIGDFHRDNQMSTAAHQLMATNEPVGRIARKLGFADANYFTRVFRRSFQVSPTDFRRRVSCHDTSSAGEK